MTYYFFQNSRSIPSGVVASSELKYFNAVSFFPQGEMRSSKIFCKSLGLVDLLSVS